MSVVERNRQSNFYGLTKQIGPWRSTPADKYRGASGSTGDDIYTMHPYKIDGSKPSPKMSVWAQRRVVTKPYDVNMRKPVPGYQFKQLPTIGLINALKGIGTRGGPSGIDSGTQTSGNGDGDLPRGPASQTPGLLVATDDESSGTGDEGGDEGGSGAATQNAGPSGLDRGPRDISTIPLSTFGVANSSTPIVAPSGRDDVAPTRRRPLGDFQSSVDIPGRSKTTSGVQTDVTLAAMTEAENRYNELVAQSREETSRLTELTRQRAELVAANLQLQENFRGSVQDRVALDERYQEALRVINEAIPPLQEHRDLAEAEIARLRDLLARPAYTVRVDDASTQADVEPPAYSNPVVDTGMNAGRSTRNRDESQSPQRPIRPFQSGSQISISSSDSGSSTREMATSPEVSQAPRGGRVRNRPNLTINTQGVSQAQGGGMVRGPKVRKTMIEKSMDSFIPRPRSRR